MPRSLINVSSPTLGTPVWAGDFGSRDYLVPGGATVDPAQFPAEDAVIVNVGAAGALAAAVTVPVDALTGDIPNGTQLWFSGAKVLRLTAAAKKGDVALTTAPLAAALVDADIATYYGSGRIFIPSGTALGRTYAERDAGTGYGPAADADDEVFLNFFPVSDARSISDVELYRGGGQVFENFVPNFSTLSAAVKAKLRAFYQCTIGAV